MCDAYQQWIPNCNTCHLKESCNNPINPYRVPPCYKPIGITYETFTRDYWPVTCEIKEEDPRGIC